METEFKVLSDEERVTLRKIKTTPEQADQILRRNQPLLEFLKGLPRTLRKIKSFCNNKKTHKSCDGTQGCPHCKECTRISSTRDCRKCAWFATLSLEAQATASPKSVCLNVPFGGVTWQRVYYGGLIKVEFQPRDEFVYASPWDVQSTYDARCWRWELDRAIAYVEGHIEWAKGVKSGEL